MGTSGISDEEARGRRLGWTFESRRRASAIAGKGRSKRGVGKKKEGMKPCRRMGGKKKKQRDHDYGGGDGGGEG